MLACSFLPIIRIIRPSCSQEPVIFPEQPRLALGKAAMRPVTDTFGKTSTQREFDQSCASSELRDWMRETGYFAKRPYHKKGLPACSQPHDPPVAGSFITDAHLRRLSHRHAVLLRTIAALELVRRHGLLHSARMNSASVRGCSEWHEMCARNAHMHRYYVLSVSHVRRSAVVPHAARAAPLSAQPRACVTTCVRAVEYKRTCFYFVC